MRLLVASLPITDKLTMLDALRERSVALYAICGFDGCAGFVGERQIKSDADKRTPLILPYVSLYTTRRWLFIVIT